MKHLALVLALMGLAAFAPQALAQPNPFYFDLKASVCGVNEDYDDYPGAEMHLYLQVDDPVHPGAPVFNAVLTDTPAMQSFPIEDVRGYRYCGPGRWCMVPYRLKIVAHNYPGQPVVASLGPITIQNYSWQWWYFRRSDVCPQPVQWKGPEDGPAAASWGTLKGAYR